MHAQWRIPKWHACQSVHSSKAPFWKIKAPWRRITRMLNQFTDYHLGLKQHFILYDTLPCFSHDAVPLMHFCINHVLLPHIIILCLLYLSIFSTQYFFLLYICFFLICRNILVSKPVCHLLYTYSAVKESVTLFSCLHTWGAYGTIVLLGCYKKTVLINFSMQTFATKKNTRNPRGKTVSDADTLLSYIKELN